MTSSSEALSTIKSDQSRKVCASMEASASGRYFMLFQATMVIATCAIRGGQCSTVSAGRPALSRGCVRIGGNRVFALLLGHVEAEIFPEHQPRLRVDGGDRSEQDERHRHERPLEEHHDLFVRAAVR